MTKEELEKEAEEYSRKNSGYIRVELTQAYLAGAEPREKRIAELEAQIEKMKSCGNCKHFNYEEVGTGNKDCILWQAHKIFCKNKDKWELRR